jgi:uncharacterized membrane protein YfcA
MFNAHVPEFFLVSCIFFAAGIVKGVLGMGLPTLAMGLLGLLMAVPQAAGLLTLPSLLTNVWQALMGGALRMLLAQLWSLQAGIALGVAVAACLPPVQGSVARLLLGACLLAYGGLGLAGWRPRPLRPALQHAWAPCVGAVTGVITALTGVFVLPAVPYLQSLQLDRQRLAQALGICFTTSTVSLAVLLGFAGELGPANWLHSGLMILPALAGMVVGQKLRQDMSEVAFRKCFFGGLVLLGLSLVALA